VTWWSQFGDLLTQRVSPASLALFRIGFGLVMAYEAWYAFTWPSSSNNFIQKLYTGPNVHWSFPYPGFSWVHPWPEPWTSLVFAAYGIAALFVAAGLFYRPAAIVLFLGFTATWLMEEAYFLNHFYLASLLAFLLIPMPAAAWLSLDHWRAHRNIPPDQRPQVTIPFWPVFLLRAQMFLVYTFAGIAKLNPDWLVGEPVRLWFQDATQAAYLENFLNPNQMLSIRQWLGSETVVYFIAYGGLLFDLTVGTLLLLRRTRWLGFAMALTFHGVNFFLFNIGAFPVMATWATLIFFPTDWPLRLLEWIKHPRFRAPDWGWLFAGALLVPGIGAALGWKQAADPAASAERPASRGKFLIVAGCSTWILLQVLIPLRHLAIAGPVHWTDEGSRFSWFMLLRHKEPGYLEFRVEDSALMQETPEGVQIDWDAWSGDRPAHLYRDLDARRTDWSQLPEIVVLHEPFVGQRILYNPLAAAAPQDEAAQRQRIESLWQERFGRSPRIIPTRPLDQILSALRSAIEQGSDGSRLQVLSVPFHQHLLAAQQVEIFLRDPNLDETTVTLAAGKLQELFARLQAEPNQQIRRAFLEALVQLRPFAGQGALDQSAPFLVIFDEKMHRPGQGTMLVQDLDSWYREPVFLDLERIEPGHLAPLGQIILLERIPGQPELIWNYDTELQSIQIKPLRNFGYLQHQYAQHIADRWQARFGRRPAIYVSSHTKLNQHPMQSLVDPRVDLARAPITHFGHNDWILPHRRAGETAPPTAKTQIQLQADVPRLPQLTPAEPAP
jgi:hypothetical protein